MIRRFLTYLSDTLPHTFPLYFMVLTVLILGVMAYCSSG